MRHQLFVALLNLGALLSELEEFEHALPLLEEAMLLVNERHVGRSFDRVFACVDVGACLVGLGRFSEAAEAQSEAIALLRPLAREGTMAEAYLATALVNIADSLVLLRRGEDAIRAVGEGVWLRRAAAHDGSIEARVALVRAL